MCHKYKTIKTERQKIKAILKKIALNKSCGIRQTLLFFQ